MTAKTAISAPQYDVIVIGSGIGGLVTATQLAAKGIKVLVLERYVIPGGSAGYFERQGYRFDVGASMIFGFGDRGGIHLCTGAGHPLCPRHFTGMRLLPFSHQQKSRLPRRTC